MATIFRGDFVVVVDGSGTFGRSGRAVFSLPSGEEKALDKLFILLCNLTGHDFSQYKPSIVSHGKALLLANEYAGAIDLLMTVVMVPGMSGHELAQKLFSRLPKRKTAVHIRLPR